MVFPLCQDVEVEVNAIVASVDANEHRKKPAIGVLHHDVAQASDVWVFNVIGEFFGHGLVRVFSGGICLAGGEFNELSHFSFLCKDPETFGA
jgi:hypothetical protein